MHCSRRARLYRPGISRVHSRSLIPALVLELQPPRADGWTGGGASRRVCRYPMAAFNKCRFSFFSRVRVIEISPYAAAKSPSSPLAVGPLEFHMVVPGTMEPLLLSGRRGGDVSALNSAHSSRSNIRCCQSRNGSGAAVRIAQEAALAETRTETRTPRLHLWNNTSVCYKHRSLALLSSPLLSVPACLFTASYHRSRACRRV